MLGSGYALVVGLVYRIKGYFSRFTPRAPDLPEGARITKPPTDIVNSDETVEVKSRGRSVGAIINLLSHVKIGGKSVDPEFYTSKTVESREGSFALVELIVIIVEGTTEEGKCSVVSVFNTAAKSFAREVGSVVRCVSVDVGACANTMSAPLLI